MTTKPLYYVLGNTVRKRSVETQNANGTTSSTMGFIVCECSDYVDGAAEEIAASLNAREPVAQPPAVAIHLDIHPVTETMAVKLMVHHLMLASAYFEAIPEDITVALGEITELAEPARDAAGAWLLSLQAAYDVMD